jgi:hypothetical protein
MKRPTHGPSISLSLLGKGGTLAVMLFVLGCVNLDKPESVRSCANSPQGCSDNPSAKQRDAAALADGPKDLQPGLADASVATDAATTASDAAVLADRAADGVAQADVVAKLDTGIAYDLQDDRQADGLRDLNSVDLPDDVPPTSDLAPPLDVPEPDSPTVDLAGGGPDVGRDVLVGLDAGWDTSPSSNCITQIIGNGYKAGSARPCSACTDGNGGSLATQCTQMLDCLAPPSTSADFLYCLNYIHGSSLVGDCVNALTKVACPTGY